MTFDIDTKIELNKERLKYDHSNLRNLQNSYGYVVIYLSFIGLTFFDFIQHFKSICYFKIEPWEWVLIISILISAALIFYTLFLFIKFFLPREIAYDRLPKFIYDTMFEKVSAWAKKYNKNADEETKLAYLDLLEKAVEHNFNVYKYKRLQLYKTIKFALISLIPYFFSLVIYKLNN